MVGFSAVVGVPAVLSIADVVGSQLKLIFLLLVVFYCKSAGHAYVYICTSIQAHRMITAL